MNTTPSRNEDVLKMRARLLATGNEPTQPVVDGFDAVVFPLGPEQYAVDSEYVLEIFPIQTITHLPCTPPHVVGIINVRGEILPVIQLKRLFDLPGEDGAGQPEAIIIKMADTIFGILSDNAVGLEFIAHDQVHTPSRVFTGLRGEYVRGVTSSQIRLLDIPKLIENGILLIHEDVHATA